MVRKKDSNRPGLAIIGAGYWGKNLVRNFAAIPSCRLTAIVDTNEQTIVKTRSAYPSLSYFKDYRKILNDPGIDAVVIATKATTHYAIAKQFLLAGKDVYVEKPLSVKVSHAEELCELAEKKKRVLMVGHLLLYHPAMKTLRKLVTSRSFGRPYYAYSQRLNLGKIRSDENALWTLAPHDISVFNYLLGHTPESVTCTGKYYIQNGIEDVVFFTMNYPGNIVANSHISWLDPHKVRRITLVGEKKMVVFDDMQPREKVWIYEKSAHLRSPVLSFEDSLRIMEGEIRIPHISSREPLRIEGEHFIDCVVRRGSPFTGGRNGLEIVTILAALEKSMRSAGKAVKVKL